MTSKLEIQVEFMPVNLQKNYCKGRYAPHIIACQFYDQAICLFSCKYAQNVNQDKSDAERRITQNAGWGMRCV